MKIAILINNLRIGGAQTLTVGIAEEWKRNGIEVEFVATQDEGNLTSYLEKLDIKYDFLNFWAYKNFYDYLCNLIEHINNNGYDAIFLNYSKYGQIITPYISPKIKIISVIHGIDENSLMQASINSQYINGYIAVSPKILELASQNFKNDIVLIPNGISSKFEMKKDGMKKSRRRIVYSGRISHHDKGVLLLPEIYKKVKEKINDIELLVIGEGPDLNKFIELVHKLNLTSDVTIAGKLSNDRVKDILSSSDILLAPSFTEGFGLSIVEAQSVGCVPIVTKIEGVTDYIVQNRINGVLVEASEINSFVEAAIELLENKEYYTKMSNAAIENSKRFSIDKTAKEWKNLLEKVVITQSERTQTEDTDSFLDNLVKNLSLSTSNRVYQQKKEWLTNTYIKNKSNLTNLQGKRIVIFGTLEQAYHVYIDAISISLNVIAFVDNNSSKNFLVSRPIWKTNDLLLNADLFDVLIISKENDAGLLISELQAILPVKEILDWKELK